MNLTKLRKELGKKNDVVKRTEAKPPDTSMRGAIDEILRYAETRF